MNRISNMLLSKKNAREQNGKAALTFSRQRSERASTLSSGTAWPPLFTLLAILAMFIATSLVATKYKYVRYPASAADFSASIFDG